MALGAPLLSPPPKKWKKIGCLGPQSRRSSVLVTHFADREKPADPINVGDLEKIIDTKSNGLIPQSVWERDNSVYITFNDTLKLWRKPQFLWSSKIASEFLRLPRNWKFVSQWWRIKLMCQICHLSRPKLNNETFFLRARGSRKPECVWMNRVPPIGLVFQF